MEKDVRTQGGTHTLPYGSSYGGLHIEEYPGSLLQLYPVAVQSSSQLKAHWNAGNLRNAC